MYPFWKKHIYLRRLFLCTAFVPAVLVWGLGGALSAGAEELVEILSENLSPDNLLRIWNEAGINE